MANADFKSAMTGIEEIEDAIDERNRLLKIGINLLHDLIVRESIPDYV